MSNRIGKKELVQSLMAKGYTKKDASAAIDVVFETVSDALKAGDEVSVVGFGTFDVRSRSARQGIHPQTKEPLAIPAKNAIGFKAGKELKAAVNA